MNKKRLIVGIVAAIVVIIATIFIIFMENKSDDEDCLNIDLYFFNENYSSIVAENTNIKIENEDSIAETVLEKLMEGPSDVKNKPVIEKNVRLLSVIRSGTDLTVDFSKEYMNEDESRTFLSTYALVKTLCQLERVRHVMVTVEGEEIIAKDGTILGFLSDEDIDLVSDSKTKDSKRLILYFADKDEKKLVEERRTIKITDKIPVEQYIVNELIKGTEKKDAKSLLSKDTELISVETTDDTCFVNFKSGFIEKNTGDNKDEELILYSVINSLCEYKNISSVQFLIDGKKTDKFGNVDISNILGPDDSFIK